MPAIHAKLSASGSARWLNCPASVRMEANFVDQGSSAASEGTTAHELGERCLKERVAAASLVGETSKDTGETFTVEMADYVQQYVDYCNQFDGEMFVEEQVNYGKWVEDGFGTSDCIIIRDGVLRCIDLKYGKGVRVDAEENTQGMLYGLGAYSDWSWLYDVHTVVITIHQPRLDHVSEWEISVDDLLRWARETVRPIARLCYTDHAPMVAGEKQCQWCKAKATCPALYEHTQKVIGAEFDDLDSISDFPSPGSLSEAQVAMVLQNQSLIVSWLNAVNTEAFNTIMQGGTVAGFKVVEGRSNRKWKDEDMAITFLESNFGEDAYTRKMLTVPQAEKKLGKARIKETRFDNLVDKPAGKPTLAPESDKRPPIGEVTDDFDELS